MKNQKRSSRKDGEGFDVGVTKEVADEIGKTERFAQDEAGNVYRYSDGVYKSRGAEFIKRSVKRILEHWNRTREWTPRLADAVVEYIRVDSPVLWTTPAENVVNVANGLLRLADRTLLPHSPSHLSSIQLAVKYDPLATCPATDKFDSQVFPQDAVILSHEIAAVLIHPALRIQKALLLLGEGGNGKSRKLNQYRAFVGSSNCAAVSLHDLESNRFASARLFGKLANICPDLPSAHLAGTSKFKAITGGDHLLTAEFKFKTSFEFDCHARLIFSANHPPRSDDASEAFFDRWLVVPFQGRFRGTAAEIPEAELDALLTSPSELSGLLNHALACMDRMRKTARFSEPDSVRQAHSEFYGATDPFAVWLDRFTVNDPEAVVSVDSLRAAYGADCERRGMVRLSQTAFGLAFNRLRPAVDKKQRTLNNRLQWCYVGIGMASSDVATSHSSQGSQSYLSISHTSDISQENLQRENPVNPVKAVKEAPQDDGEIGTVECDHLDAETWVHRDGKAFCAECDRYMGRVRCD